MNYNPSDIYSKVQQDMMNAIASADFPTIFGNFRIYAFKDKSGEHLAVVKGEVAGKKGVPVRLHSQCLTGDALGSLRCDCRQQLSNALTYLGKKECGVLIYLAQEGRGIGLVNKIKSYEFQDRGHDTVEANRKLGFGEDLRDYSIAAKILKWLKVSSVILLTNNPQKVSGLIEKGIHVQERIPLKAEPNKYNSAYLETKQKKMNHMLG